MKPEPQPPESLSFKHFLSYLNEEERYRLRERVGIHFDSGLSWKEAEQRAMKENTFE